MGVESLNGRRSPHDRLEKAGPVCKIRCLRMVADLGEKAIAADGLITIQSHYGPKETMRRLEAAVKANGLR